MGLWLKCPVCQAKNHLDRKVCAACDASLEDLPPEQRVYVLLPPGAVPEEPSGAAAPEAESLGAPVPQVTEPPEPPALHQPAGPVAVQGETAPGKGNHPKTPRPKQAGRSRKKKA